MPPSAIDIPTTIRTFASLLPAIVSDDTALAKESLRFATLLSSRITIADQRLTPCDAALARLARVFHERMQASKELNAWDKLALANACREALNIGRSPSHKTQTRLFETALALLEDAWREEGHLR